MTAKTFLTLAEVIFLVLAGAISLAGVILLLVVINRGIQKIIVATSRNAHEVVDTWTGYVFRVAASKQELQMAHAIVPRDEHGLLGVMVRPNGTVIDLDERMAILAQEQVVQALAPYQEQLLALRLLNASMPGRSGSEKAAQELLQAPAIPLPDLVRLEDYYSDEKLGLEHIPVGVKVDEGKLVPVDYALDDLMHMLVIGLTSYGKSSWVLNLVYALEQASEPVKVYAVDISGAALNLLATWHKLMRPIARTEAEAAALMRYVLQEKARRQTLYERYPLADSLKSYNAQADEPLPVIVVLVDEGAVLLDGHTEVSMLLTECLQTCRQYGIFLYITGQAINSTIINTKARQFGARLCFRATPSSTRIVLDGPPPERGGLQQRGRAWAMLPGEAEPVRIQTFFTRREQIADAVMNGGGPQDPTPWIIEGEYHRVNELVDHVLEDRIAGAVREQIEEGATRPNFSRVAEAAGRASGGSSWTKFTRLVLRIWREEKGE